MLISAESVKKATIFGINATGFNNLINNNKFSVSGDGFGIPQGKTWKDLDKDTQQQIQELLGMFSFIFIFILLIDKNKNSILHIKRHDRIGKKR